MLGLQGANSSEFDPSSPHPVIDLMHDQRDLSDMGGTMRLGAYYACSARARRCSRPTASRWSASVTGIVTSSTTPTAAASRPAGFVLSGTSPDKRLVEFVELDEHPFYVGTQAHPEFKSRPDRPIPVP